MTARTETIVVVLGVFCLTMTGCAPTRYASLPDADDGVVDLECTVNPDGTVSGCVVLAERPAGLGLGDKALTAAASARMSPRSVNGVATGGRVRFTVTFKMENGVLVERPGPAEPRP